MKLDLTQDDQLKQALDAINPEEREAEWLEKLEQFLVYVRQADEHSRKTRDFHLRIWEDNPVSNVGMGTVDIGAAIDDPGFRDWFAAESVKPLANSADARVAWLRSFHAELVKRLKVFSNRTPHVKIFRVLAALYPQHFTTITYQKLVFECHHALFGKRKKGDTVQRQMEIRDRLDQVIGACDNSPKELAERLTLAWFLYTDHIKPETTNDETEITDQTGEVTLNPLPAVQRRKGFTAIKGGLGTIASAIRFVVDGVTREDLVDFLRAEFPDYKESTIRTLISVIKNEFQVIQDVDGILSPTDRGEVFLENGDVQELIPLFLTRVLGVDHVLLALAREPQSKGFLIAMLQKVHPGWTSDYVPSGMLKWLKDFDLIEIGSNGVCSLTEAGKSWTKAIHWQPESLEPPEAEEANDQPPTELRLDVSLLEQAALIDEVIEGFAFAPALVNQLHIGLWAHTRRHFAILAGLSGSGKTLLAQRYARSIAAQYVDHPDRNVFIQAVQPGWYDPAPLFGYINPLSPDSYVRSPLLDFLLLAARHPEQPFTVILDEMNLSHPEQYFAPVLSAMESGDRLRLHNESDVFDGVPATIAYPANVAFIGTVNMDETTHGLSDKVLDRAFTVEFWDVDLDAYPGWQLDGIDEAEVASVRTCLAELLTTLAPERLHFGWRTVDDVLGYLALASRSPGFELTVALDDVVYARVLPKLRGSESNRLHQALQQTTAVLAKHGLSRSHDKVSALQQDLADTGMMRFWR